MDGKTLHAAEILKQSGMSWNAIERVVGVTAERLRRQLDPGYVEQRNAGIRRRRKVIGYSRVPAHHIERTVTPDEAAALLSALPQDTRDLTARAMGDPLPGRSALDRRVNLSLGRVNEPLRGDD